MTLLRPYQRWLSADPHPYLAIQKARRIGGSFGVAHRAALRAMGLCVTPRGLEVSPQGSVNQKLISASLEQSSELLSEVWTHIDAISRVYPDRRVHPRGDPARTKFKLRNGTTIRAFPDNPRTARGGQGDVTLDEFAYMRDQKAMWAAVKYIADPNLGDPQGYRLTVCTTPLGEGSLAHEICVGDRSRRDRFRHFSRYRIDIYSAVRHGFPDPSWNQQQRDDYITRQRAEAGDPETFAQECECSWLSASSQFLSLELLGKAQYEAEDLPKQGETYGGVDIGRKKHLTVIARGRKVGDTLWVLPFDRDQHILHRVPFKDQEEAIGKVIDDGARRVAIDATGIGSAPAESLEESYPGKVESVTFTNAVKEELATSLRLALESGRLRIPNDRDLKYDLASLRKIVTGAGNIRYDADDSGGSHADWAWAVALLVHAAMNPIVEIGGRTGKRVRPKHRASDLFA